MKLTAQPDPPCAGAEITVCVEGGEAESSVTVTLSNGAGDQEQITINLDSNGDGCEEWTIPAGWAGVNINAPGADERTLIVNPNC